MPKFHKKQTKRMTGRLKNKIIKKVAEHNRKVRREKKKNPPSRKPKDPGVPNSAPFKDDVLREAEQRKLRAKEAREIQKANRSKLQNENRTFDDLVDEAVRNDAKFQDATLPEPKELQDNTTSYKSYFKELKKVVESADVVLQVLDSRDPTGSRCPQIEQLVISSGKKLVLVLNKIDLIPKANLEAWLKYLRQELPTVAFKASTQLQNDHLSQSKVAAIHINESLQNSSRCIGASFLMKVLGNYCRNQNIQTLIKVGVVGFPNVGKSSVINSLKRSRSCVVGATPGITKSVQEVALDKHIRILDCPGVVFAKDGSPETLALRNVVKIDTLKDVIAPAEAIVQRADHTQLCLHYTLPPFESCHELFCLLAKRMGKYKKGGIPNYEEGAKRLINDWNRGMIKYYTHPPESRSPSEHIPVTIVSEFSKAFDISALEEQMELDKAPELFPSKGIALQAAGPTEGFIPTDDLEEEKMEQDASEVKNTVTVDFKKKKAKKKIPVEENTKSEIAQQQQNKLRKKKFKKMKKNKRRLDKAANALSESIDNTLTIE